MNRATLRWLLAPMIGLIVVLADQWTKGLVEANLPLGSAFAPFPALERYFNIVHWSNTGVAFGMLGGQNTVMMIVASVVIVAVLIYSRTLPADQWAMRCCLGLQLGGAAGNLVDRFQQGHVTDYLLFSLPVGDRLLQWPAWNVADGSIVVGTILLGLLLLRQESADRRSAAPPGGDEEPSTEQASG